MKKISKIKSKQPRVSIVFVTWNGKEDVFDLMESFKKITYKNYDIIAVDNASTDGTQKEFKKKYGKTATIIENEKNLGLEGGTNVGMKEALKRGSKYVLSINNDMIVKPDFLDHLVEVMEDDPKIAIAQPKLYYMEPKNVIWCAGCKYRFYGYKILNQDEVDTGQADQIKFIDAPDGSFLFRGKTLKEEGLLDGNFFIIHGEVDWCMRVAKKGYKFLYVPKSVVWHKVGGTFKTQTKASVVCTYYNIRNWLITIKKNKSFPYYFGVLFSELTFLAFLRFIKYLKNKQPNLIKVYHDAVWHAISNKTPKELYPYKK